ncbi:MAG: hypothetical protein U0136_10815 [Bdellovibrionota bacterium]
MSVQEQQLERSEFLAPFDWGVAFALRHVGILFQISLIPALLKIFLRYVEYYRPISPRNAFLIVVLDLGAKTWLLVTIMLLCIISLQGVRVALPALARRALLSMPKVMVSCVCLILIVAAFFLAPWMYIFVLFLLWAPIFTACEIPAKSFRAEEGEDDDLDDEDIVRPERRILRHRIRYFADKPLWDLGFARSIHFAANRRNFVVTVQLALLFLVALTLPLATVVALAGYYHSFGWVIVESVLSFFVFSLVLAAACSSFLQLLPPEVADELGIVEIAPRSQILRRPIRFHGRILPFFLLALLGGMATKATIDYIIVNNTKPPTLVSRVNAVQINKQQFIITLDLEDKKNLFRWLSPLSFQLQVVPDNVPSKETPAAVKPSPSPGKETAPAPTDSGDSAKQLDLLEPDRAMPFTIQGEPLPEESYIPYSKPLRLVLYFANSSHDADLKGKYVLYYVPVIGDPEKFAEGRIGG